MRCACRVGAERPERHPSSRAIPPGLRGRLGEASAGTEAHEMRRRVLQPSPLGATSEGRCAAALGDGAPRRLLRLERGVVRSTRVPDAHADPAVPRDRRDVVVAPHLSGSARSLSSPSQVTSLRRAVLSTSTASSPISTLMTTATSRRASNPNTSPFSLALGPSNGFPPPRSRPPPPPPESGSQSSPPASAAASTSRPSEHRAAGGGAAEVAGGVGGRHIPRAIGLDPDRGLVARNHARRRVELREKRAPGRLAGRVQHGTGAAGPGRTAAAARRSSASMSAAFSAIAATGRGCRPKRSWA